MPKFIKKHLPRIFGSGFFLFALFVLLVAPVFAQAGPDFSPLVPGGLPGFDPKTGTIVDLIRALYKLAIVIGAMIAVVKIVIAGVKYVLSSSTATTASAKEDIKGSLFGLVVIVGAVVILQTINPDLAKLDVFENTKNIKTGELADKNLFKSCAESQRSGCSSQSCTAVVKRSSFSGVDVCDSKPTCSDWCNAAKGNIKKGRRTGKKSGINYICHYPSSGADVANEVISDIIAKCGDGDDETEEAGAETDAEISLTAIKAKVGNKGGKASCRGAISGLRSRAGDIWCTAAKGEWEGEICHYPSTNEGHANDTLQKEYDGIC